MTNVSDDDLEEVFSFLDELRESGVTNMFGAALYVEEEFGFERNIARHLVSLWMRSFSERHSAE